MMALPLFPLPDCTSTSTRTFFLLGVCDGSTVNLLGGGGVEGGGGAGETKKLIRETVSW